MRRLFRVYFRPHAGWFGIGVLFSLMTSAAAGSYGVLIKFVGDRLQLAAESGAGMGDWIWGVTALILLAAVVRALALYAMTLANNTGIQRALVGVQNAQFSALTDGDFALVSNAASGGLVSRFINDINALRDVALRVANGVPKAVATVLGALAAMIWMDWQLAALLALAYPLAFGPVIALGDRVRSRAKRAQVQVGEVTSLLSEGFRSSRIVKAYGLEAYQKNRAAKGFRKRAGLFLKVLANKAAVDPILEIAGGAAVAGVLAVSAWRIVSGSATIGDFLGFVTLIGIAAPDIRALGSLSAAAQEGGAAADRVFEILDAPKQVADAPGAADLSKVKGAVAFENVDFAYGDGPKALNGLSFSVAPGETVALVGPSGAGKSTVFNLLLRLFDPSAGQVRIDGRNIATATGASVRRSIGLVAQDAALFDDTVHMNIALGRLDAVKDEVEAAARAANAYDFIMRLPQGFDTEVGEMGERLSGGQRQRIALARAILRDAPILLLDEATSALDAESEAKVQEALVNFARDRTTIVIAHRLSTIRKADRIIVIQDGAVVEQGTHHDLCARNGVYARLAALQFT